MNEEQNTPEKDSKADKDSSRIFLTTDSSLESKEENDSDKARSNEDYYAVDNPKKEVHSTIGDGEMHNEGLLGSGTDPEESPFNPDRMPDEQDKAELRDAQG